MGRPFDKELANVPENISFALQYPVESLRDFFDSRTGDRILACGAGGSFSAASFAQNILQESGFEVHCVTPLEILQTVRPLRSTTLLLLTAGGRNKDVIRVIKHAANLNLRVVLVCASIGSPASKTTAEGNGNYVFEFRYPYRRDGFLALNSLAVTWWLIARAFGYSPPSAEIAENCISSSFNLDYLPSNRLHTVTVLHDKWTRPVAIDLESKMTEAALGSSLVSDWRQFGHGRHHWFAKNAQFSSLLAVRSVESSVLADKTMAIMPESIPKTVLSTESSSIQGACELLLRSFAFVGSVGRRVGIDPGRPGVPPFGSKLYHLAAPLPRFPKTKKSWDMEEAVERKLSEMGFHSAPEQIRKIVSEAADGFAEKVTTTNFGAVVLDFDGTIAPSGHPPEQLLPEHMIQSLSALLKRGIRIGIATGRGDSCHGNLENSFPESMWKNIFVCHYNGWSVQNFGELMKSDFGWRTNRKLKLIYVILANSPLLKELVEIRFKKVQITLRVRPGFSTRFVEKIVLGLLSDQSYARLVSSSHTLDIVPAKSTKRKLVDYLRGAGNRNGEVLCIGDRGDLRGNDFQLLATPFSLSVDRVSPDLSCCWNFLPRSKKLCEGTSLYLQRTEMTRGHFRLIST